MYERGWGEGDTEIKIGADGGQGLLKICVQLLNDCLPNSGKVTFILGHFQFITYIQFQQGSVHKLQILVAVPDIQELYLNLQVLWEDLQLADLKFFLVSDLKIGNKDNFV